MNYYNPYLYSYPYNSNPIQGVGKAGYAGLFSKLKTVQWGDVLNNTNRALNIANQAIPLVRQATPMIRNAKSMFKVLNEFKKLDTPSTTRRNNNSNTYTTKNQDGPTFFV
jgi:LytS/YehU family sensor histidine kinase